MQDPQSCILIVEDKAIIAHCFERSLTKSEHDVVGVVLSDAWVIQKAVEGRPDLALMDIE